MSRAGITKKDVATAVSSLRASGKPTTTRVVRLEIGKGSYRTIGKLLDELGAKSSAKPSVLPSVPEAVQRQFADALYNVWEAANQAAAERSDAMQVQCEQRVGTLSAQLAAESAERRRLDMQLCTTDAEFAACKRQGYILRQEVAMLRDALRLEKALHQRSESDRAKMLKQFASRGRNAIGIRTGGTQATRTSRKSLNHGGQGLTCTSSRQAKPS